MSSAAVVPRSYSGEGNWQDWREHFEQLATAEGWDEEKRLFWLKFRLVGAAQRALQTLPTVVRENYADTMTQLEKRF